MSRQIVSAHQTQLILTRRQMRYHSHLWDHCPPPPPLYKLRPCPSYSGCRDRINLAPNLRGGGYADSVRFGVHACHSVASMHETLLRLLCVCPHAAERAWLGVLYYLQARGGLMCGSSLSWCQPRLMVSCKMPY